MPVLMPEPKNTLLGKDTVYKDQYNPDLLQAIPRALGRDAIGDHDFRGVDIWRLYELSWLNSQGVPQTAIGELLVPASTHSIVESKSLKLYAGSFAMTRVSGKEEVACRMSDDLSERLGGKVTVRLYSISEYNDALRVMPGISLDTLKLSDDKLMLAYETEPSFLEFDFTTTQTISQTFSTTVFRSLCPVTGQPDLASVMINYKGQAINREGLFKYLISYRCHKGFHEQCVEQIYHDLREAFNPELLEVYACFTRRGGIDINPFRSCVRDEPSETIREKRQ
ncbi:MAG TPA: NADPH-dependent 7-cyano-7-deazaguanine reductase QueF [Candidatus Aphodousia faecigallinarum]|uniref:NADPH-dependent 7-cyano-7-deazaguanine reductase QueF n=1 Tax=Candidatus Aphodousia faecigallinarum TaxID=2840677 RepID=A0A9D1ILF9_9BURK|nr:NADPH-dependent 7-cyano-7-deazaguanine reductase QueF [Candidatus Aphodousia faecigallinarum]